MPEAVCLEAYHPELTNEEVRVPRHLRPERKVHWRLTRNPHIDGVVTTEELPNLANAHPLVAINYMLSRGYTLVNVMADPNIVFCAYLVSGQ